MCVQIRQKEENDLEDDDSKEESDSYNTPLEDNMEEMMDKIPTKDEGDVDPIDPYTAQFTDDEFENDSMFDNESEI